HPTGGTKELDELIEAELKKVAQGWGDSPEVRKARAQLYGKRNLAAARKQIEALPDGEDKDALQRELTTAFSWRVKAVQALRDEGRFAEARETAQALKKAVAGVSDWEQQAATLLAEFDQPDLQKELAASKKIDTVFASIRAKKLKVADAVKPMRSIAKSAAGTKSGARAETLAALFEQAAKGNSER
ncbi:MAG TPA: hypothetical protein VK081_00070, partial [Planctomycetota bacterium]|nr:hypothetical protein [Planctomycetota bacterium]